MGLRHRLQSGLDKDEIGAHKVIDAALPGDGGSASIGLVPDRRYLESCSLKLNLFSQHKASLPIENVDLLETGHDFCLPGGGAGHQHRSPRAEIQLNRKSTD